MHLNRPTSSHAPRRISAGSLAAFVAIGLLMAACGRKGAPEFDTGEPIAKAEAPKNELIPGLNLPQKQATPPKAKKPKGNFVLDPLL